MEPSAAKRQILFSRVLKRIMKTSHQQHDNVALHLPDMRFKAFRELFLVNRQKFGEEMIRPFT